jgi:hypothetical protein
MEQTGNGREGKRIETRIETKKSCKMHRPMELILGTREGVHERRFKAIQQACGRVPVGDDVVHEELEAASFVIRVVHHPTRAKGDHRSCASHTIPK